MTGPRAGAVATACIATAIAVCAQWLLVRFAYDGNWTALFYSGEKYGIAPHLGGEDIHVFADTYGYDGQIYHVIAHDPLMRAGVSAHVDAPRLRYRRILLPLAAWTLAGAESSRVDRAYRGLVLACVFAGVLWTAGLAVHFGRSPCWGAAFLLLPATIVSLERMTVDIALAALVAGWALAAARGSRWQWAVLALAPLARETGLILIAGASAAALLHRSPARAALAAATAIPALTWFAFVQARTPDFDYENSFVPLSGIARALVHPAAYAFEEGASGLRGLWDGMAPATMRAADVVALAGILAAFALAGWLLARAPSSPRAWAAGLFAAAGVLVQRPDNWIHVYDFGRVYSPLLLLLAVEGFARREWKWMLPWALIEARLLLHLAAPAAATVRGLLG
jgi:hypothetical protein